MVFRDRDEAGQKLAERLLHLKSQNPIVLALPRGGVSVAFPIARALAAPLGLVLVRKIGAPGMPELAVGAVADGPEPEMVSDPHLMAQLGVSDAYMQEAKAAALLEIERRRALYLSGVPPVRSEGRVVILVDDGIATGATMRAALHAQRRQGPSRLVVAVPVASPHTVAEFQTIADEVICLHAPADFMAVGQFYRSFPQLEDQEVIDVLRSAAAERGSSA